MKSLVPRLNSRDLFPEVKWPEFDFEKQFENFMDTFSMNKKEFSKKNEDGSVSLEIEAPGFNKDNIDVHISSGLLKIYGERKTINGGIVKLRKDYSVGRIEDIEAEVKDGILNIRIIPSREETGRRVNVK